MSLLDTFDPNSGEILSPGSIYQPIENFPELVILTFEGTSIRTLQALEEGHPAVIHKLSAGFTLPVYRLTWRGRELGVVQTLIGGAGTAGLMEELLALGAKRFLLYGACGVLDREVAAGRFILPTAAYRDEGTSYHYLPAGDYVQVPTAGRLGEVFEGLGLPYVTGRTWTTDAIYRETRNNMAKRKAEGCIAVDMECASAMAVGQFRGAEVFQYFYAEDSLDGGTWDARSWGKIPDSGYERYLRVALEIAARL